MSSLHTQPLLRTRLPGIAAKAGTAHGFPLVAVPAIHSDKRRIGRARIEPPSAEAVLTMFREGLDTFDIASRCKVPERVIASLLHQAREAERTRV